MGYLVAVWLLSWFIMVYYITRIVIDNPGKMHLNVYIFIVIIEGIPGLALYSLLESIRWTLTEKVTEKDQEEIDKEFWENEERLYLFLKSITKRW